MILLYSLISFMGILALVKTLATFKLLVRLQVYIWVLRDVSIGVGFYCLLYKSLTILSEYRQENKVFQIKKRRINKQFIAQANREERRAMVMLKRAVEQKFFRLRFFTCLTFCSCVILHMSK